MTTAEPDTHVTDNLHGNPWHPPRILHVVAPESDGTALCGKRASRWSPPGVGKAEKCVVCLELTQRRNHTHR
jgi:hypothetical protein